MRNLMIFYRFKFAYLVILTFVLLALSNCRRSDRDNDTELLAVQENAIAYHIFEDAFREVHRVAMRDSLLNDTGIRWYKDPCIKRVTFSDTVAVFPIYVEINYGDDSAKCNDGFIRYGKINAAFTGKYLNKNTVVTITFSDYKKDDYSVSGTCICKNLGLNADGHMQFLWTVEEGLITGINTSISWSGKHHITWVAGRSEDSQGIIDDDVFYIDGYAEGRCTRGNSFTNEINGNYVSDLSCQWFTSGRSILDIPNMITRTLNYGDGECDNILIARRNDSYFEVRIPY